MELVYQTEEMGIRWQLRDYAQIIVNNTTFNTAMVSDGWDNGVYYLNLDTSQYSDLKGTVFKL